jgi:hypothetical protein
VVTQVLPRVVIYVLPPDDSGLEHTLELLVNDLVREEMTMPNGTNLFAHLDDPAMQRALYDRVVLKRPEEHK